MKSFSPAILFALAALLAITTAAKAQATASVRILKLTGEVHANSADKTQILKAGEYQPLLPMPVSFTVVSGWLELAIGETRLRTGAGASCSLSAKDPDTYIQTKPGTSPVQITDSSGNVTVLTEDSSLTMTQGKKQIGYKISAGKSLLTDTNGETYILKAGDSRSVGCARPQPQSAVAPDAAEQSSATRAGQDPVVAASTTAAGQTQDAHIQRQAETAHTTQKKEPLK